MVTANAEDRALFKKLRFHTVILDEAHMLKNMASQRYENLMKIKVRSNSFFKYRIVNKLFVYGNQLIAPAKKKNII